MQDRKIFVNPRQFILLTVILLGILAGLAILNVADLWLDEANQSRKTNVLLVSIDALRPDHLSCYGYQRQTTPNINKVAEGGARFTQAITHSSHTCISLPTMMSSTYFNTDGMQEWTDFLDPAVPTLAEVLKRSGYYTTLITNHGAIAKLAGLKRGMDEIYTSGFEIKADGISQEAVAWLERNQSRKFFLYIHYFDTHGPYRPPPPYNKKYLRDGFNLIHKNLPIVSDPDMDWRVSGHIPNHIAERGITDADYYVSQYDGGISFTDAQFGTVLDKLRELGLDKNTLIIICADHGEAMGEHNFYFVHGFSLYDELLKVPLIIKYEPLIPKGKVVTAQVKLLDIMPTVLEILAIKKNKEIEGESLLSLMTGEGRYPDSFAFSDVRKKKSIRGQGWKLIYTSSEDKYELYNLKADPGELSNLVGIEKNKFKYLKRELSRWIGKIQSRPPGLSEPFDEDFKERLRSLGYAQ